MTEVCLENLRDVCRAIRSRTLPLRNADATFDQVLDDTLDFSKLTNSTPAQKEESYQRSLVEADLEDLVASVVKATAVRSMRVDAAIASAPRKKVDIVFDCEKRAWDVRLDSAGVKRCLLNLLGTSSIGRACAIVCADSLY